MKNSQLMITRRVFVTLSGATLTTISGCLGVLGIGNNSEAESNSGSGADGGSTDESTTSDAPSEQEPNSSENTAAPENEPNDTEAIANESTETGSEENEAAVPESNPQNDPAQTEAADPNTTKPPTSDDIELIKSSFSTSANEARITVRNTSDRQMNSIDLWIIFYNDSGQQVDEGMNGATGVGPDQTVTITVPPEASDATAFEIQRVMVST